MADSLDLKAEVARVLKARLRGPGDLAIWGGVIEERQLGDFLAAWSLPREDMPWCLWEHVSSLALRREALPGDLDLLERGRVFGEAGDLALRRDGSALRWSFVGRPETALSGGTHTVVAGALRWSFVGRPETARPQGFHVADYWEAPGRGRLLEHEERALLWGVRRDGERYYDDRVARAQLVYPLGREWPRVSVHYRVYMDGGRPQFIWLQRLEGSIR